MHISTLAEKQRYFKLTIDDIITDKNYRYGYMNLKIESNIDDVKEIEFLGSSYLFDRTYPYILKDTRPFDILRHNVLPIADLHTYEIRVDSDPIATISYDIVKILNPKQHYQLSHKKIQYHDYTILENTSNPKLKLIFCHQITKIKIFTLSTIRKPVINFQDGFNEMKLSLINTNDSWRELDFGETGVCFRSHIDCIISYETDGDKHDIHIFGISWHINQIINGMIESIWFY